MWLHIPPQCQPEDAPSSPATRDWTLPWPPPCPATVPSFMLRGKDMQPRFWPRVWRTARFLQHLSGVTSGRLTDWPGQEAWISFWADSPARTYLPRAKGRASKGATDPSSGLKCSGSFAMFDPATSSWKTSQHSLFGDSILSSRDLPASGSMRNGRLFEQVTSGLHTAANGSSCWPTPAASMPNDGETPAKGWPTPVTQDSEAAGEWKTPMVARAPYQRDRGEKGKERLTLIGQSAEWQTPQSRDWKSGTMPDVSREELDRRQTGSRPLSEQALLFTTGHPGPETPKDGPATSPSTPNLRLLSRQLNPCFVEALMGLPSGWTAFEPLAMEWCGNRQPQPSQSSGSESMQTGET